MFTMSKQRNYKHKEFKKVVSLIERVVKEISIDYFM